MSAIAAAPVSSLHNNEDIATSRSDDLSVILAGIKLDDNDEDDENDQNQPSSLSAILQDVATKLAEVRNQFFVIQEKRHAGVFALAEQSSNGNGNGGHHHSPSQSRDGDVAEKSVALDLAMIQLNSFLESVSEGMKAADCILCRLKNDDSNEGPFAGTSPRRRTASIASLSSLDSFDDAFLDIDHNSESPKALKKRYEEMSLEWAKVQSEASTLEEELSSDKHLLVFISICEQMEGMMDSLDKALANCHDFIFAMHRERAENALHSTDSQWANSKERLADWMAVKRSFDVKKSSYGPACEQMFVTLQKGLAQKSIQNGTVLRQLADLKTRWRGLRESVAKTDKDLKRVEAELTRVGAAQMTPSRSSPGELLLTPTRPDRPKSSLRAQDSATKTPTGMNQSMILGDFDSDISPLRPSNTNSRKSLSPNPPIKPAKSIFRHSMIQAKVPPSGQLPQSRSFSSTASFAPPVSTPRTGSQSIPYQAPTSLSLHANGNSSRSTSGDAAHLQRANPITSNRYTRAGSEPPNTDVNVAPGRSGRQSSSHIGEESELGDISFSSTATTTQNRPASALGASNRPASAAGFYYRPPSASGHREDVDGSSRIPRLATGARYNEGHSSAGDRPGSALSFSSNTAYGKSPSAKLSYTRSAYPPSSFPRNSDHGNRLSMQTPEPTIAARARRMNIFAPKAPMATPNTSKRSSRPPPAKYNASIYSGGQGSSTNGYNASPPGSSADGTSPGNYRITSTTTPLTINKRGSMAWSATGRTTPLSAAALAKVPHAGPDLAAHLQHSTSEEKSSIINFRSQRAEQQSAGSRSYTPSVRSGRETPTFSDAGGSSVWGGGMSRRMAAVYSYRANPNDAIDVEVGNIVNSLGMAIERVDPPLPRGVKELNPPSTKTVKYEVGGKVIVCKLLQLHRPTSVQSNQDKTNKVLTRVGGGWIDLRQYLLSRMGTQF